MSSNSDTIVALSTATGRAGIAVVRVSGSQAFELMAALSGPLPAPRTAKLRRARDADGAPIDLGLVITFPAPNSYTGEDVAEFQGHGGRLLADLVTARLVALGARRAQPGEFSERAFVNGRLDLAQAEAVVDAINAGTATAALAAVRSLDGAFSANVNALVAELTETRVYVEASIDFPDEELDLPGDAELARRLSVLGERFDALAAKLRVGRALTDGLTVALIGRPNAGKSSLLNALAGVDAAIVTDIPGTTRDVLRENLDLAGLPVTLIDTAGLRATTADPIEQAGIERARAAASNADHALLVVDATAGDATELAMLVDQLRSELGASTGVTVVLNKIDIADSKTRPADWVPISALTGEGIDRLIATLHLAAGFAAEQGGTFSARQRHIDAVADARAAFDRGCAELDNAGAGELLAEELRLAQEALGTITGTVTSDDLLGEIFGTFCIGK